MPRDVKVVPGPTHEGIEYARNVLVYDAYPASGFELSLCWQDAARLGVPGDTQIATLLFQADDDAPEGRAPCHYGATFEDPEVARAYAENCWRSGIRATLSALGDVAFSRPVPCGRSD